MRILAIDTSCDETAAAVTENTKVLSNIIWSQASAHAKFGGVMPSLAQRMHEERIDWVIKKALGKIKIDRDIDAIAVTIGPGLSIALGVGIDRAKKIAEKYKKPLFALHHVEAHLLSSFAVSKKSLTNLKKITFPCFGLCVSGGNTMFVKIEKIGKYKVLAETSDDALGEALDKAARLLGFGYPGASALEKFAKEGDPKNFKLPIPLLDDKIKNRFSYSGLKTAFFRLVGSLNKLSRKQIVDLAASFQDTAFEHVIRVLNYQFTSQPSIKNGCLLLGGGVAANVTLRKRLRSLCKKHGITLVVPYTKKLLGDNAAMVGVAAYLKIKAENLKAPILANKIDRNPRLRLTQD